LVVDQLASDYINRYRPYLKGGIDRLIRRGAFYANGVHQQSNTATCPGHASIVTGAWPNVHGIVNNRWIDPQTGAGILCIADPQYGSSPRLLMAPSLGDVFVENSRGQSKVVTVSLKPRVAVITSAQTPSAAVWYDKKDGRFVSGQWYGKKRSPKWVNTINQTRNPSLSFGEKWKRFRPKLNYEKIAGKDARPFEYKVPGLGNVFPKTYGQGLSGPNAKWFGSYRGTPHALVSTFALAEAALKDESLGQDEHVDLLVIGISNLDLIGHWYGPHSQEAFDMLLRIDDQIGKFMAKAERRLTRDKILWVFTADHGVTTIPEANHGFGIRAKRVDVKNIKAKVDAALAPLTKRGGKPTTLTVIDPPFAVLSHGDAKVSRLKLQRTAAAVLHAHPDIAEAYATKDVQQMKAPFRIMYERVVYPGREADIMIRNHPNDWVDPGGWTTGTGHGSPYNYDTHVPIIFAGPRVRRGQSQQPYSITRIAPTIAALLNMVPPASALDEPLPAAGHQ
jgi:predicted AlkP superfamily pyrophosphatase or phosphodiesterase